MTGAGGFPETEDGRNRPDIDGGTYAGVLHRTTVRVRYAETDRMGVAYNSHYLVWFEIGRTELLRGLGLPYRELERRGVMLPVREAGVKFLKPVFYDDVLTIVARIERHTGPRVRIGYEIERDRETVATGFTEHVYTDPGLRPIRPPKDVTALFLRGMTDRSYEGRNTG